MKKMGRFNTVSLVFAAVFLVGFACFLFRDYFHLQGGLATSQSDYQEKLQLRPAGFKDIICDEFSALNLSQDSWAFWTNREGKASAVQRDGRVFLEATSDLDESTLSFLTLKVPIEGDFEAFVEVELNKCAGDCLCSFVFHEEKSGWSYCFGFNIKKSENVNLVGVDAVARLDGDHLLGSTSLEGKDDLALRILRYRGKLIFLVDEKVIAVVPSAGYERKVMMSFTVDSDGSESRGTLASFDNFCLRQRR